MSCNCGKCGHDVNNEPQYMYRNLNGVPTFTGFVQISKNHNNHNNNDQNTQIIWIGKNEKQRRVINPKKQKDIDFFMAVMKKYDP